MTNKNPRRDRITAGAVGKVDATEITSPPLPDQAHRDADDLRVERIAAQLEEAEQQRLTDDWIKEQQHPDADAWQSAPISFLLDARHVVRIPALSQTAREVLESRRQSERRAPEAGRPVQKGRGHDPSAVQPAPPAELIPFPDKQTAAADGQAQPTKPTTSQQATQQAEPPTGAAATDNVPRAFVLRFRR